MSDDWGAGLPEDPDEGLAAEYVLRLLDPVETAACAARIGADPDFAARVARWRRDLAALDAEFEPAAPPATLGARIEERLFGSRPSLAARLWSSAGLWRGIAVAALVAAGYFAIPPQPASPPGEAPVRMVAAVAPAGGSDIDLLAVFEPKDGVLSLNRVSGTARPGRVLELWVILGKEAPVSVGVLPADPHARVAVPRVLADRMGPGAVLAVTDEPPGGAPGGVPTGAPVAAGAISEI